MKLVLVTRCLWISCYFLFWYGWFCCYEWLVLLLWVLVEIDVYMKLIWYGVFQIAVFDVRLIMSVGLVLKLLKWFGLLDKP